MDEALKKIEQALESERTASRLKELLPQSKEAAKSPEQAMGIIHYAKAPAEPAIQNQPEVQVEAPRRFEPPPEIDPAAKIGVGAREFTLDELGTDSQPNKDPLMGQILKSSTFREMTLDDLETPDEEGK
ncbi:hypothetical protein HY768_11760 [candidate division TA06 bacterium]|uniref:Uncharacterized protein n=1 Tax=candidate division TA06 bacterium TaxID=2250710 RepID=A0A933IED8_UNCT6|nr:hypothetical protein [candidate division TA06 bacterium]